MKNTLMIEYALLVGILLISMGFASAAEGGKRLEIGEFAATKLDKPPTIDGTLAEGEWDRALASSGMMTPFGHEMQETATTMYFAHDGTHFYFAFHCIRGDYEWKLWKSVRENDGYSFGDPSIEIWVTPPTLVPETYQNVINTYPAVLDQQMIPTRGYTAQGWKGNWKLGVTESDTEYVIEASIPVKDFGFDKITDGDVWRFLFCRTAPGAKPRAQASWSLTQGFAELIQHPEIHLYDDSPVVQVHNVTSVFTGTYTMPVAVAAPRGRDAEVKVELRWQKDKTSGDDDLVMEKTVAVKAGARETVEFAGTVDDRFVVEVKQKDQTVQMKKGYFTLTATAKDGMLLFRQSFPFQVNGWVPKKPVRPGNEKRQERELDLMVRYGPESNVMMLRADILDLPQREKVAGGVVRVLDPADNDKELKRGALPPFVESYSSIHLFLDGIDIPMMDYSKTEEIDKQRLEIDKQNKVLKKEKKPLLPKPELPEVAPRQVVVEVAVLDEAGNEIKKDRRDLDLLRYKFVWSDNNVGISDKVIPPWTPVENEGNTVGVWNRKLSVNGLGLLDKIDNGGVDQIKSMRLVAVSGGKEVPLTASDFKVTKQVENRVEFDGSGQGAGLAVSVDGRVEFDGYVLNEMTIAPAGDSAAVDKLYLEVVLPESEATHFCATAGGWAAVHDKTPEYWSSQQTASGILIGDFVPYIWLTNSDRAFLWVADNDKGWITDDDKSLPTQEIIRKDGTVTLRIHFIEVPTELKEATSIRYAYQTFPSKPLPEGWRSIICGGSADGANLPDARNTYFWFEGDWAVLWPYYCSPFAWDFEKSKTLFDRFPEDSNHRPCVGSIAHSIGRYLDYYRHDFTPYAVDWGETPGQTSNANCTQGKGPADFRLWHYREWVRKSGFRGLYVDENYLALEKNFLTGGAYIRPDGRLQAGYSYLGLREYFKRLKTMFHENGAPAPNLWQHISSGAAYHAWLGDIFFEGENVEPTNERFDYIEVLPAGRMRAIGSSVCAGGVMTMMCQSQRHNTIFEPKHTHQFVGWVMAHDILPEQVKFYNILAQESRFYRSDVEFLGYWKEANPCRTEAKDCMVSTHRVGDDRAVLWVVNISREDQSVPVKVDWKALGWTPADSLAVDAETGASLALDDAGLTVNVLKRDFVAVHLQKRNGLEGAQTVFASFDKDTRLGRAVGADLVEPASRKDGPLQLVDGKDGKALAVGKGAAIWSHQHVGRTEGRVTFDAKIADKASGAIIAFNEPPVRKPMREPLPSVLLKMNKEEVMLQTFSGAKNKKNLLKEVKADAPEAGWRAFDISWKDGSLTVAVDGKTVITAPCEGVNVSDETGKVLEESAPIVFGDRGKGLEAIDNLRCYRAVE